jgi:oligopeptide transport system substrate-binding protein
MRRALTLIPVALLLLLAGLVLFPGAKAERRADFTFINRGETKTLDLNRISWAQDIRTAYILWEGLYTVDPVRTLEPVLGCAGKVGLSDDQTVYTFHIRPEARWTNGDDVTAHDFVFSWRRMLEEPGDYTYLFFYIRGAEAYSNDFQKNPKTADFKTVGLEVLDPKTLRVTLGNPVPYFPDICAFPPAFPLHERSMAKFKEVDAAGRTSYRQDFTRPPDLVTNGPFRLDSWAFKQRLRFVKSEHYWDRARVRSNTIDMVSCEEPMAQFLMFYNGSVDWVADITIGPEVAADLFLHKRTDLLNVGKGFGTYFYSINCLEKLPDGRPNPFRDVRVRQAFSMAIDKRPVVENVTRLGEPVTSNYIPVGVFAGYDSPPGLPFDVKRARQLLAEAGYPGGKGWPRISLLYNTGAHHADVAQIVRRQWLENLGIDLELEGVELKIFGERLHNKDYAIARASWIGDYMDPSTFTDKYITNGGNNDSGWSNKDYDRLLAEAAAVATQPTLRLAKLRDAEKILLDEQPIIPVYHYVNADLRRARVKGIKENPRNNVNFRDVYVEK